MKKSLIYSNIPAYRLIMNVLYSGRYKERFSKVIESIGAEDKSVLELCFGDLIVAQYCKESNRSWKGMDINPIFVSNAQKKGFNAELIDIAQCTALPKSDVCIMVGSLYHFSKDFTKLFKLMLDAAPKIIISEPTTNLSHSSGPLGFLARKCTNAGKGSEEFRFTSDSFINKLNELSKAFSFNYKVIEHKNRDTCVVIKKGHI